MTEEEAKERSCCGPDGCGVTHSGRIDQWGHKIRFCVGSQCMAWRWETIAFLGDNGFEEKPTEQGFCGLASRP